MSDPLAQRNFKPRTSRGENMRMVLYLLLCTTLAFCVGYASIVLDVRALVYAFALITVFAFIVKGNTPIPVSVAVASLVLMPKSLPALRIGSSTFGWGIGDILIILAFALAIVSTIVSGHGYLSIRCSHLDGAVVFYCISLVSAMIMGMLGGSGGWVLAVGSYVKSLEVLIVYITVRLTFESRRSFALVIGSFLGITIGAVSIALLQRLAPATYVHALLTIGAGSTGYSEAFLQSTGWRLAGPFLNANSLGMFFVIAVPFMMAFAATMSRQSSGRRLVLLLCVASLLILVLTLSRSSYVGFTVAFYYWLTRSLGSKRLNQIALTMLLIVLVGVWSFSPLLYRRVISYTFAGGPVSLTTIGVSASVNARLEQWAAGLQAIGSYGMFGAGFGHVAEAVGRYLPPNSPSFGGIHQTFLRALLEGGIVSLLGLLYLLSSIWLMAKRLPANYCIAVRSSLLGLAVTGLFGDTFQNVEVMVPFFYLLGGLQSFIIRDQPTFKGPGKSNHDKAMKPGTPGYRQS